MSLVDSYQFISQLKHIISKRNYDELGVFGSFLNIMYYRDVVVVKSNIYLVHKVKRCRLVVVKGENKREGTQCLLST